MKSWKDEAREYFFESHLRISDIEALTGVSRQSISAYLKGCDGFAEEKERRRNESRKNRRGYKADKMRQYRRAIPMTVTVETMRREHELAVMELSRERYH